jgi:hypothetical protein
MMQPSLPGWKVRDRSALGLRGEWRVLLGRGGGVVFVFVTLSFGVKSERLLCGALTGAD